MRHVMRQRKSAIRLDRAFSHTIWGEWNSGFLFAGQGVLDAANGVLDLALSLVSFSFRLELAVTGEVAGSFLHVALHLLQRAFGPVVAHGGVLGFAFLGCQSLGNSINTRHRETSRRKLKLMR